MFLCSQGTIQAVTPHHWQHYQHSIHRYNLIKVYSQQGYNLEHTFFPDEWYHEWCPVLCHTSFHYVLHTPETYAVEYPLPLFHGQWTNIHGHFLQVPVEFEKYLQQQNKQSELQYYWTPHCVFPHYGLEPTMGGYPHIMG